MTEEILLGDYTITLWTGFISSYDIHLHNKKIGFVRFFDDMSLHTLCTNDTDLITLLLLRYQVSPDFKIYQYKILLGDYTLTFWNEFTNLYDIYLHNEGVGWVYFKADMSLHQIGTNDTDLITLLLLRYQVSPDFKIYPYEE